MLATTAARAARSFGGQTNACLNLALAKSMSATTITITATTVPAL
jgi:hypothetical protein